MEENTQEPTAPEGANSAPSLDPAPAGAEPETTAGSETPEPVAEAAPETPPAPAGDWSHLRGLQAVEPPTSGWAERGDYAEEFAKEMSARAARFVRSVDESIVLSSEGVLRWLGEPVARVVSGERLLSPRAVLLADEVLAGEEREAAQTRATLWLAAHVKKLLGPLVALEEGAELPEAARALGARIGEALGVLERERVRNDVRALDQSTRGAFRKLGVRFGSLYIYVPQLLKPGPRALATQLWMLQRGAEAGADQLLAFASAGRTSFANDGALSPEAYRVAGYRLCGERVVRVDIVERLSDLIRAALPDTRGGSREPGEGFGFLVTPQMTSLTGCSGEAFASILRSLNFEPVKVDKAAFEAARRKAPTEPIKPAAEAALPAPEGEAAEATEDAAAEVTAEDGAPETAAVEEAEAAPEFEAAPTEEAAQSEPEAVVEPEAAAVEAAPEAEAVVEVEPEAAAPVEAEPEAAAVEVEASESAEAAAAVEGEPEAVEASEHAEAAAVVEAEQIEVWRPAPRRARAPQRPPRAERPANGPHRRPQRAPEGERAAAAGGEAAPKPRDEKPRRFEGPRDNAPREKRRDERPRPERNRDERPRDFAPRRDNRPADPDSPFAKLAALKPLLEQRDKRN